MTSKKTTRRALFSSFMALLLCCSMLVGTTFAWFTDTVTSTGNIIKSGTLDVEMSWSDTKDGTYKDASTGAIFDYKLWEPGFTQTKYVRVVNMGDLAFQYRMHITPNVQPAAGETDLADVIDVYVAKVDSTYGSRDDAMAAANKVGTLSQLIANAEGTAYGALLPVGSTSENVQALPAELQDAATIGEATFCITLHMQESAGNEYQDLTVGEGFAVRLLATQLTAEFDSFGSDYDANAVWPGDIDTNWYTDDPTAAEFTIGTAEELAGLAALVNGTNAAPAPVVVYAVASEEAASAETTQVDFNGRTIKLSGNIDLKHMNWVPIGNWENTFAGTFDGQGYTISNLYIDAPGGEGVGLFGVAQNATIKGINVNNVNITGYSMLGTIVGSPYTGCIISDCHVTGDIKLVAEYAYVGGISAYGYVDIDNCSVIADGTGVITSETRNAVGGISGWSLEGDNRITNCVVKNLDLTGWANIGAITGFVHYSNVIDGCAAENVTITKTRVDGHPSVGLAAGGWSYHAANAITITNNSFKNVTLNGSCVAIASADILYGSEYGGKLSSNFVLDNNTQENITNNLVMANKVTKVTTAAELQAALDAASAGDNIIVLDADITGDVTVTQKPDVKITINGSDKTFAGVILVDGKSGTYTTAGLTIKDVNFKADSISADACIRLGDGTNATRYTCNVTVSGCTFDVPGAVGIKSYTGGDKNLTITGCTATSNAHSLVQAKGIDGVLAEGCYVYSKNGLNFNNSDNVTVSGCTVDVKGYAVRFGESSGGVGAAETYLIQTCTLKSACDDGDAVIILRGTADNATLTIKDTTIEGTIEITNTATGATVVR